MHVIKLILDDAPRLKCIRCKKKADLGIRAELKQLLPLGVCHAQQALVSAHLDTKCFFVFLNFDFAYFYRTQVSLVRSMGPVSETNQTFVKLN